MRTPWPLAVAVVAILGPAGSLRADFIVVANLGPQPVSFVISHPNAAGVPPATYTLKPLENRAIPSGKEPEIAFTLAGKPQRFRLDPYASYLFAEVMKKPVFQGIELAGPLPAATDVAAKPPAVEPLKVPVALFTDQFEPRNKATWQPALVRRVTEVSAVLKQQTGVTLEVVAADEWQAEVRDDLFGAMREFEKKAPLKPGVLALGFLTRTTGKGPKQEKDAPPETLLTAGRGPFGTHFVFADRPGFGESERQELMLQEFGLWLGAAHTKDPFSVMRQNLADGSANRAGFPTQFDPVNLVVVNIWAKYRRAGKLRTWADITPVDRDRLEVLYKTLAQICPDSPIATEHLGVLERIRKQGGEAGAVAGNMPPKAREVEPAAPLAPPADAKPAKADPAAVKTVVAAVSAKAKQLAAMPAGDRPRGDRLTEQLVRTAATAALALDQHQRSSAFLAALGIALDDSTTLRKNPLTKSLCEAVETDAERAARIAALGTPTFGSRRDLCQHFAISAALAELYGPAAAETAGITKELADMAGTSGFSFVDLTADLAGVAFAKLVKGEPTKLSELAQVFRTDDYLPDATGLREGLSPKRFADDYGTISDPRFEAALKDVRRRVAATRGLR